MSDAIFNQNMKILRESKSQVFKVRLRSSIHGRTKGMVETVRGLGLKKIGQVIEVQNIPQRQGMMRKVNHMIEIMEK